MSWTQLQFLFCCDLLTFGKVSSVPSLIKTSIKKTTTKANVQYMNRCETYTLKNQRPHDGFLSVFLHSGDHGRQRAEADLERAAGVAWVKQQRPDLLTVEPTAASCTFSNCIFIISQLHYPQALCRLIMFFFFFLNISRHWYWNTADVYSVSR